MKIISTPSVASRVSSGTTETAEETGDNSPARKRPRTTPSAEMEHAGVGEAMTQVFNGHEIRQRPGDGYLDGTAMCKVGNKKIADWRVNKSTKMFLEALSDRVDVKMSNLCVSTKGGDKRGGTWIHPFAAVHLAMWIDATFAVSVIQWTARFLGGDRSLEAEITARADKIEQTTTVTTTTIFLQPAAPPISVHARLAEQHAKDFNGAAARQRLESVVSQEDKAGEVVISSRWIVESPAFDRALDFAVKEEPASAQVYFLRAGDTNAVKVGYSNNIEERIARLQTAQQVDLSADMLYRTSDYRKLEAALHTLLKQKGKHLRGEWFEIEVGEDCFALIAEAKALM
jgi:hypothetical protein